MKPLSPPGAMAERFAGAGITIENTDEARRRYREIVFTSTGFNEHISGVIFHHETFYQKTKDGIPFVQVGNCLVRVLLIPWQGTILLKPHLYICK